MANAQLGMLCKGTEAHWVRPGPVGGRAAQEPEGLAVGSVLATEEEEVVVWE